MPAEGKQQTKLQAVGRFFWDQKTGKCLGRTGESWAKIIGFYIALYALLAAIWTLFFYMFQQGISIREPKWQLEESLIGTNPGLGFRPRNPPDRIDSALISYTAGKQGNYDHWVKDLNEYFEGISHKNSSHKEDCSPTRDHDAYCPFDLKDIPPECRGPANYSFGEAKPCILIKINRIYGWKPKLYEKQPKEFPNDRNNPKFNPANIHITCEGQNDIDKEHLGPVKYHPPSIETKYYPFLNQPGYQSPFVMVHFLNPKLDTLIFVECKAWAQNIEHERFNKRGSTSFELFIESPKDVKKKEPK